MTAAGHCAWHSLALFQLRHVRKCLTIGGSGVVSLTLTGEKNYLEQPTAFLPWCHPPTVVKL